MNEFVERISKLSPKRLVLLAAELQARLQTLEEEKAAQNAGADHSIAVIGIGLRFPGGAQSPQEFWDFLCAGGDGIRKTPAARWDADALFDPDPDAPGKLSSQWGGFVDGIDQFDPQFFGITPREANTMDPQQRMMLEVCWEALERAGYAPDRLGGSQTGVFVGACNSDYYQMVLASGDDNLEMYTATGGAHSVISGRISYLLGLQGPSLTVDTACSSSLVALHLACRSLRSGECDLALAGGVNAILSPDTTIVLSKAKMMAPDGRCKAFDARADGFVRSEGCGAVVLKRLADALVDGDQVLAVVRGSAMNQDGRSNGLTAPNGPAQVAAVRQALADAGVEPQEIGYVETHGTGTSLGDPIEVQALAEALGTGRDPRRPLLIGSVKTNIGHMESAAGVAGFIKLVLALQHGVIPPHLHLKQLNPHIAWDELPVSVPAAGSVWEAAAGRRLGGVSSFGFSGSNVHMILEDAPPSGAAGERREEADRPLHLLTLSARSEAALQTQARNLGVHLAASEVRGADVAYTANNGRALFAHRLALAVGDGQGWRDEAIAQLQAYVQNPAGSEIRHGHVPGNRRPAVAFLFSGHGGQYAGMGRELYAAQPVFRRAVDECDALFRPLLSTSLLVMFEPGAPGVPAGWMESMTFAQPALFALQYALAQMWRSWGVEPAAVAGHSIGEYAAACVAGVLTLEDAVKLVAARSQLMDAIPEKGVMAAIFAEEDVVAQIIADELADSLAREVAIAAANGPQATVISGSAAAVDAVMAALANRRVRSRRLAVAQGAHSPLIDGVLDEFAAVAASVAYAEPQITFVSSLLGRAVDGGEISQPGYWRRHLRQTVRFADAMQALHAGGADVFVEIGPSPMLLALGQRCLPAGAGVWAPSLRPPAAQLSSPAAATPGGQEHEWRQVLDSVAVLFTYGVEIDWAAFDRPYNRRRFALPTYPFERQRYWFAARSASSRPRRAGYAGEENGAGADVAPPVHPLLGRQLRSPALQGAVFETEIGRHAPAFLDHHTIFGVVILPSPAYLEMALAAAAKLHPAHAHVLANFTIHAPLLLPAAGTRTVQLVLDPPSPGGSLRFQVLAWEGATDDTGSGADAGAESGVWRLHATGDLMRLDSRAAPGAAAFDLASVQARCPQQMSGAGYYDQVRALGLEFGDNFQGIRQVWIGDGEALGHLQLPVALAAQAQHYRFHPALLDACFHLLGAPLAKHGMEAAYLLIGIERFTLHRAPGAVLWNHTRIVQMAGGGAEYFTGDIQLYDDAGQLVAEVTGLQLKRADRSTLLRAVGAQVLASPADGWVYRLDWSEAALSPASLSSGASVLSRSQPGPQKWLILADTPPLGAAGVGERLAELLAARGDCPVSIADPGAALSAGQLAALLAQEELHSVHGVIYLWGMSAVTIAPGEENAAGHEQRMAAGLLHLAQAFARRQPQPALPGGLWVATREAQPVAGAPDEAGVRQAPLWGLGRVIALEQPQLWGGLIDLGPESAEIAAAQLLAELDTRAGSVSDRSPLPDGQGSDRAGSGSDRCDEDQVAWRNGRRYVLRLLPAPRPAARQPAFRRQAAYLITGGLGGLGLAVARWLAQHGAGHLVLVGRRGLTSQALAVAEIEQAGAAVTVVAADVADERGMAALFARFGRDVPPLAGIVHAAADLSSAPVADLDVAQLDAMLRPKVQGAWNLHRLSSRLDLDFFLLFSSTTALLGAVGLAHYAAANAFLDSFAHYRRRLGLPALSINWGTWSIMRAASLAQQGRVAEFGLQQMPAEDVLALLGDLLAGPLPQAVVAAVNWSALKPAYEARRQRPLLALLGGAAAQPEQNEATKVDASGVGGQPQRVTEMQAPPLLAAYRAARPEDRPDLLIAALRGSVAKIVGMADPEAIDLHQGLFEMGMDSLMSVELKTQLERQVGCALPSTLTFNYPTIHDLAGYLVQNALADVAPPSPPMPAVESAPGSGGRNAAEPAAAAAAEIDDLSEDELAQRLMQRLRQLR